MSRSEGGGAPRRSCLTVWNGAEAAGHLKALSPNSLDNLGVSESNWNQWPNADRIHWPAVHENAWLVLTGMTGWF